MFLSAGRNWISECAKDFDRVPCEAAAEADVQSCHYSIAGLSALLSTALNSDSCTRAGCGVAVTKQNHEIRFDASPLTALNFGQTDLHHPLAEHGLIAHAPAQINCLKTGAVRLTQPGQLGKHVALKRVALLDQVLKGGADEDAECASCDRHMVASEDR